jgi:adenine-specific DNA-methyltransferase
VGRTNNGKVELTWTNKSQRLVTFEEPGTGLPYDWVSPTDYRVAEVRLVSEVARVGEPGERPNYLIRGDSLHALAALGNSAAGAEDLTGKVKLAYLDPPFNTGKTFSNYEDNLEVSIYLTMMRDRLRQIQPLLAPTGSIWVHCDDSMMAPLRLVMNEVFLESNFIATFVWQKVDSPSDNHRPLSVDHDFIICYSSQPGQARFHFKPDESVALAYGQVDPKSARRYRHRLLKKNGKSDLRRDRWSMWFGVPGPDGELVFPIHDDGRESRWAMGRDTVERWAEDDRIIEDELARNITWKERPGHFVRVRPEPASKEEDDALPRWHLEPDSTHWVPYTIEWSPDAPVRPWPTMWSSSASTKAQALAIEALNDESFGDLDPDGPVARAIIEIAGLDVLSDVKTTRQAKQHLRQLFPGVPPFDTPKPEELMARIIEIATDKDDLVLDPFAGSAATAATAHKLGRRWVTIEFQRATVERFCLPRLAKVVAGEDMGGITRLVGWEGGDGFVVLDVAPSMFVDEGGVTVLADWAAGGVLGETVAAQLGFSFEPAGPFCGRKGRTRLAVIDGLVNDGAIDLLVQQLDDREVLLVCGTGLDPDAQDHLSTCRPGSTAQLIPQAILAAYGRPRRWTPTIRTVAAES